MRHKYSVRKALLCAACLVSGLAGCGERTGQHSAPDQQAASPPSIIPAPRELAYGSGEFRFTPATRILFAGGAESEPVALYFSELLQRTRNLAMPVGRASSPSERDAVSFELRAGEGTTDEEGYSLVISPERITVSSRSPRGLFYGAVTLWQLVTSAGSGAPTADLPAMQISDAPRFRWRGLMLDSARHYQSPEFIKRLIDVMALHKLNVLHWHLTDDQGWRLEIKKYPRLTEVGAWRVPAGPAAVADLDPATGKPRTYGGFYTQEQVRDIVAHAQTRHVTIVPEIDMPGHASAAVAAYPELASIKSPPRQVPADWGIYRNLFNVEEGTFAFLEDVLAEVVALFPSEYIHVGGDEAVKDQWHASARVQARMRELGIKDEHGMQSYFIGRMGQFLEKHQRRLIGWDEILDGGLPPNATVMSWRGIEGAVAAAGAGHDAVLSPAPVLYLDNRPLDTPSPPGRGPVVSVEDIYRFDPAPAALTEAQRKHIIGVQANLWTEHVRTEERAEYMIFPRAAALAEVAWSPADRVNWQSFESRLPAQLERYAALGIRYARAPGHAKERASGVLGSHDLQSCTSKILLSLEDDAPTQGERAIFLVDIMNPCWIYRGADLSQANGLEASVGQVPFNFQIGDDVKHIPLRRPATSAGELEVRLDGCEGEKIATLPLAPAAGNFAVTALPPASISPQPGKHDLCFMFTQRSVDPTWVIDSVRLVTGSPAADAATD